MTWLLLAALASASPTTSGGEANVITGVEPQAPPDIATADARTEALARKLRCPVCQALSVADSTSEAATSFRARIHGLVSAGYTDDDIVTYFRSRYGDFILLDPPREGLNWLIWLGPGLMAGLGIALATRAAMQSATSAKAAPRPAPTDPYEAALTRELDP